MNSVFEKMNEKLVPIAMKISSNRYLTAIKEGFFGVMPIIIVGSIFLLLTSIPINGYEEFMAGILGENWNDIFMFPYRISYGLMSLYVVVGIAKSLANHYKIGSRESIIVAFVSYFMLTPLIVDADNAKGLPIDNFGASGLFLAIISSCLAVEIYRFILNRGWTIKLPDAVPQNVAKPFESLIPATIIFIIFNIIRLIFVNTDFGSAQNFIFTILQQPLQSLGSTLPATCIVLFIEAILWCFGLHGSSIVSAVMNPIWRSLSAENAAALELGQAATNIVNYQFIANFVKIGGTAATLGLAIVILLTAKSSQYKALGKLSIVPALFNINEPIVFGLPIVLNPIMAIPFIIANIAVAIVTYATTFFGLVPVSIGVEVPWTTPPIISGFLLCGWQGAVLQIVLILVSMAIYYPFFKMQDKQEYDNEQIATRQ